MPAKFQFNTRHKWMYGKVALADPVMAGLDAPSVRPFTYLAPLSAPVNACSTLARSAGTKAVGIVFGSAIGGLLVQPAEPYPSLFSATGVFGR